MGGRRKNIRPRHGVEFRAHLGHHGQALLHLSDLLDGAGIRWLKALGHLLERLAAVHPLLQEGLGDGHLGLLGGYALLGCLAARAGLRLGDIRLALPSLAGLLDRGVSGRGPTGASMVVVDTLHVVLEVPLAGKSVARDATLAAFILAEEWFVAVTMKAMRLALMAEETGGGGEPSPLARLSLAPVRLQVRINKFAGQVSNHSDAQGVLRISTYS